ncbi:MULTISPECIES: phosphotransferase [unclassified Sphingobium]|uniref:phosphotransferase n=1 Tax=unclassified Sphingobium TaxID=2611147 RepID=UPI0015EB451F|nr:MULTISPECIES: phosphotransferase [unclassified Sphingobium]MCW2362155.1 aminoglycoside phosphotransferase (APT) family kinase protein [Sphingobium sp. B10D3B]MCW2401166.1 aminoglycoside phosphotransferase (APT) family kinase protein [Sphingobium sp. B10D7B]MCW2408146.1 aminoglycoside phosphotransferase (APT) family kinase protein [Sphingobium xanthum]
MTLDSHPALRMFREVIPLSGFSGATVALVRDGGQPFVRKAANLVDANGSLRDQAVRQQALAGLVEGCAGMPEVLDMGEQDGLFYFDMAFIPSRDAVNFLSNGTFDNVADFADRVERLMSCLAVSVPVSQPPLAPRKSLLVDKLQQIADKTGAMHEEALAPLVEAARRMDVLVADEKPTAAHGDLTFENILVDRRGALWLIDTITSPFDHVWIDWSKLFQECEGLWHAHRGRPLARGVTWWLRQRFHAAATALDPAYPARHYILLGLTFARILPYAKTDEDRAFVARRVAECGRAALDNL